MSRGNKGDKSIVGKARDLEDSTLSRFEREPHLLIFHKSIFLTLGTSREYSNQKLGTHSTYRLFRIIGMISVKIVTSAIKKDNNKEGSIENCSRREGGHQINNLAMFSGQRKINCN